MKMKLVLLAILLSASIGCAILEPEKNYFAAKQLHFPTEREYDVIKLLGDQIIAFDNDRGGLFYALENSKAFEQIPDKRKEFCPEDNFYKTLSYNDNVTILPDQRVGLTGDCMLNETYMFAYDLDTRKMEKIVEEQLPVPANNFSWNPTMTKGVQDSYTRMAGTIFWLDPKGSSAMDIVLSDGTQSWSLATDFPDIVDNDQQGIAAYPVWSPDGKQITFIATFDSIGKSGFSRFGSKYSIYTMDYESLILVRILDGIYTDFPITLAWSPDGKYLSFTGKYGFPRRYGLWILNIESENVYFIDEGVVQSVWRSDGKSIVGMKCFDGSCEREEVWDYWLEDLK